MLTILDGLVTILASSLTCYLYFQSRIPSKDKSSKTQSQGFLIINTVSHARYLPEPSSHAFVYPTLTIFVNLHELTSGRLNLGLGHGLVFGVGKRPWSRIANIRPATYLLDDEDEERIWRGDSTSSWSNRLLVSRTENWTRFGS